MAIDPRHQDMQSADGDQNYNDKLSDAPAGGGGGTGGGSGGGGSSQQQGGGGSGSHTS